MFKFNRRAGSRGSKRKVGAESSRQEACLPEEQKGDVGEVLCDSSYCIQNALLVNLIANKHTFPEGQEHGTYV